MLVSPIYSSSQGSQQTIIHKQVWLSRLCKKASRNNVVRKPFLKERKTTITEGYKIADLNQLHFVSFVYFHYFPAPSLSDFPPPPLPPQKGFSSHSLSLFDALNTMATRKNGNCLNYYDWECGWVNKLFLSKLKKNWTRTMIETWLDLTIHGKPFSV